MNVVFATCAHQPAITQDDEVLAAALAARGVTVIPIPWTEIDPYAVQDAPPIVLRSTWDYHRVPTMFRAWLEALTDSGRTTWNDATIAAANVDKLYLRQLESAGIAIPRTQWLDRIERGSLDRVLEERHWRRAVLKPRIAATAYGTFLIEPGQVLSDDDLVPARSSGALLQEFVPEISERGEISIVYFERQFSHAVVKQARAGEFRVQKDYGGQVRPAAVSADLRAFGDSVLAHVPDASLYARVDVVESSRGPLLIELELIEPELYFLVVPEAADRMAHHIIARLHP